MGQACLVLSPLFPQDLFSLWLSLCACLGDNSLHPCTEMQAFSSEHLDSWSLCFSCPGNTVKGGFIQAEKENERTQSKVNQPRLRCFRGTWESFISKQTTGTSQVIFSAVMLIPAGEELSCKAAQGGFSL